MKKNGFTLIEILVVIVLLAAVSVTVGVSMNGISERNEEKEYNNYIEKIENAACLYAEVNNITSDTTVTIKRLLSESFLRNDLVNPKENKKITEYQDNIVNISYVNNEKKCEFLIKD